jgi:uncharacterized protein YdeI (YjbR/CyaY-like superfamily)
MPSFDYKGPLCHMAAFKQHAVFGIWKWKLIKDPKKYLGEIKSQGGNAMGNLGRITNVNELPPDSVILNFIKQACKLNEDGVKLPAKKITSKPDIPMPVYFKNVLAKNKKAKTVFEAFSPSHKREYLEWITEAKTEETRNKRMATTIEWLTDGKIRNWKYVRK